MFYSDIFTTYLELRGLSQASPQPMFFLIVRAPFIFACAWLGRPLNQHFFNSVPTTYFCMCCLSHNPPLYLSEMHPYSYFQWCGYFWGPWVSQLVWQMSSQCGSLKLLQGLVSNELTDYLSIFNLFELNKLRPYYQKHVSQITFNQITL